MNQESSSEKPINTAEILMVVGKSEALENFFAIVKKAANEQGFKIYFRGHEGSWMGLPIMEVVQNNESNK